MKEPNTPFLRLVLQAVRYGAAAFLVFLADYLTLWLLTSCCPGVHYLLAAVAAFIIGLAVNYIIGVTFVFRRSEERSRTLELGGFVLISLVALGVNELVLWCATDLLGVPLMFSKLFSGALTFLWNFFARRLFLYPESR